MPFQPVSEAEDRSGGNFTTEMRRFFNRCGTRHYNGSLRFADAHHRDRIVPIFHDDCLDDDKPATYALLQVIRRAMRTSHSPFILETGARSIHQNENGYLPYKDESNLTRREFSAPIIFNAAVTVGALPHNQASAKAKTRGYFMEYTFQDGMHQTGRFVVDYRFGFVYMTLGHYHADSFALLIRSSAELNFDIMPTLPVLNTRFVQ